MRTIFLAIAAVMVAWTVANGQTAPHVSAGETVVLIGRVIDGTGAAPIERGAVVVRGERIVCAGRAEACPAPAGARVIDAGRGTILPGLIDLHVHVWDRPMLSMFLPAGVTTIRDVHNTFENLAVLDSVSIPSPRLFRAGPLVDGRQSWPGAAVAASPAAAAAAVDSIAARRVDLVKLYNGLPLDAMRAAAEAARRSGKHVTADLLGSRVDALQAMEAGVEGFEHAGGFSQAYQRLGGNLEAPLDSALLDRLARAVVERRAYIVPTLIVAHQYAHDGRPDLHGVPGADRVPQEVRVFWTRGDAAPPSFKKIFSAHERFAAALTRRVAALGGRVGAGSDLPNPYVTPGGGLHQELELLVGAGLTPLQALKAATGGAADILGRDDLGVLAAGKAADIIVVDGDPSADVKATRGVRWVVRGGRVHAVDSLLALAPPVPGREAPKPAAEAAPALDAARLATGTIVYRVAMGADTAGADTVRWSRDGGAFVYAQRLRRPGMGMTAEVRMASPGLAPISSAATQEMGGNRIEVSLAYTEGRVKGRMVMPAEFGGTTQLDAAAPVGTYDGSALAPLVAALPLREGAVWTLNGYNTYVRGVSPYRVSVGAVESIETAGLGTVRAFRVEVSAGVFQQVLWISEAEPRWLVASEIPSFGFRGVARTRLP